MGDGDIFPSFFYSTAPLHEKIDLIKLNKNKKNDYFWGLSVENESHRNEHKTNINTLAPYEDNEGDLLDCGELEDSYEINPTKSGKYMTSFYVPSALHATIIGPKGFKLRELQDNTRTLIKVPKPNETGEVKITGPTERSVASARTQIALLLLSKREKLGITHFISIPMCSPEILTNFGKFKESILKGPSTRGIDETIFQKPEKFHLTIVTLTLLDEVELEKAKSVLDSCKETLRNLFPHGKTNITLKGLEIMNDDPSEVDVLYGKVVLDSTEKMENFQILADEILEAFSKCGLARKSYDNVKLHVTLMNSLFRKNDGYQSREKTEKRESFDATYILDQYRDYYFGKTVLKNIDLSIRFTTSKSGYYDSVVSLNL